MFKLMEFCGDDIRLDEKNISERISRECRRSGLRPEGVAAVGDALTVICSSNSAAGCYQYRLSPLAEDSKDALHAELRCRYDYGFRTVGAFRLADGIWLLTEKEEDF